MGKIIAVASGKGGTGKTTTVAAVSSGLAALGYKTLCIDFDRKMNTLNAALCVPVQTNIGQLDKPVGGAFLTETYFEHPRIPNLFVLPFPAMGDSDNAEVENMAPLFNEIRDNFDYCLIDTPTGVGAACKMAHFDADMSMIITTGELPAMSDVLRASSEILDMGVSNIRLIVNRILLRNKKALQASLYDIVSTTGIQPIGMIPEDNYVFRASHDGIPLALYGKRCSVYHFLDVSRRITGETIPWRIRLVSQVNMAFFPVPRGPDLPEKPPQEPPPPPRLEQADDIAQPDAATTEPPSTETAETTDDARPGEAARYPLKLLSPIPEHLVDFYGDPDLWVHSTFIPDGDEPLVLIKEFKPTSESDRKALMHRNWLHDKLDEYNIPYHIEIGGYWKGRKDFNDVQSIYVKKAHAGKAISLIRKFEIPPEPLPERLKLVYGDPELWAHSTFEPDDDEALVLIHEIKPSGQTGRETFMHRIWVHDLLDDNNIPYHIEIGGHWKSRKNFNEIQSIYVKRAHSGKAIGLMRAYDSPENILDDAEPNKGKVEDTTVSEDGVPQKICPSCGKAMDFDYYKCPHCKAIVAMDDKGS